jgi:Icc-related predicted phosphoesterase
MKALILSDLHIGIGHTKQIRCSGDVDLVIVAGDTCERATAAFTALRRLIPEHIPIATVLGNHEFYRTFHSEELVRAHTIAPRHNILALENRVAVFAGVRLVGCTLWTDYALFGEARRPAAMRACAEGLADHRLIGWQKRPWRRFRPTQALQLHLRSKAFLTETLATPFRGTTVVVTHHAPHARSVPPEYATDLLSAAYASDLERLILEGKPDLWVHGHIHARSDYRVGHTRIVCNAHGYHDENEEFDAGFTVELS